MNEQRRNGWTVPLPGPLAEHGPRLRELADLGYSDIWSAEADGFDAFTPLAMAAAWEPRLRLGTAIVPAYTRGPATIAQSAAAMASAAPGRFALGIGSSSNVIVERWNGLRFDQPYQRVRDVVRFVRAALTGDKISHEYETFSISGFRLSQVPEQPPKILVAALRSGMLRLGASEADGVIINWLGPRDVRQVASVVADESDDAEIVGRIMVCPTEDGDAVRAGARRLIAAYLNVPVYRDFHRWLGRAALEPMFVAWEAGDRARALEVIPDEVIDELIVWGTPHQCRAKIDEYFDNGVTTSSIALLPLAPFDYWTAVRDLAPGSQAASPSGS